MNNSLKSAIENLYLVFKPYQAGKDLYINTHWLYTTDTGISQEPILKTKDLHGITLNLLTRWSNIREAEEIFDQKDALTPDEIKFFLPRMMELLALDFHAFDRHLDTSNFEEFKSSGSCSFVFKNKLNNSLASENNFFSAEEKNSLKNFFKALLEYHLAHEIDIQILIESALLIGIPSDQIISLWHSDQKTHKSQVICLFNKYHCLPYLTERKIFHHFTVFCTETQALNFIEALYLTLSPEELAEVGY